MQDMVVFRDFQEQVSADHNNIQLFARKSFDDIVHDAVTASARYSGFNTVKSNQAEITTAIGRFYGANSLGQVGAVFAKNAPTVISLVPYLAVSTTRILLLTASGSEDETDIQTRDFLTNTTTGQTEPQAVPMQLSRDAVLNIVAGAESGTPNAPATPSGQVAIASIVIDTTQVVSVTMLPAGLITSTENLNSRALVLEAFDALIAPRVTALASDIAALMAKLQTQASRELLIMISSDVALLKAKAGLPATYAQYGASYMLFADSTVFDTNDSQSLGFAATIENGCRFPAQNAALFTMSLFNPIDPNVAYQNGLVLPAYTNVLKVSTATAVAAATTPLALGQYGYQTFNYKQLDIPYYRIRAGGTYFQCSNGASWWQTPTSGAVQPAWLPNFASYQVQSGATSNFNPDHLINSTDYLWVDTWTQPYWTLEAVNHTINGALVAQTVLMPSDTWLTQVEISIATVASNSEGFAITVCQCTNGQPDMNKVIARGTRAAGTVIAGLNIVNIPPTYAQKGDRLAFVITSNANHSINMLTGGSYSNGSFFYSLDGAYFLGDFTKEIYLNVYGAKFASSQTLVEFAALNLSGGIRAIDLTVRTVMPDSCDIIYEIMPDGTGTWLPISISNPLAPFAGAPVLARFRARFIGTPDIAPGLKITDSICKIWAPANQFKLVTEAWTLTSATTTVTVQYIVENWDVVAHTLAPKLYSGGPLTVRNPTATTTVLLDASRKRYQITANFTIPSTTSFVVYAQGNTTSIANVFHIAQLLWYAI